MADVPIDPSRIEQSHLECRTWGHAWRARNVTADGAVALRQVLECMRCGGQRSYSVHRRSGEIVACRPYVYPEGYLMPKGTGRLTKRQRGQLRAELTRRFV